MMSGESRPSLSNQALIVAGPTCSGKSAFAVALAEEIGGAVINADAMQCYADLRILTARPSEEDEKRVPHFLYGVLDGAFRGSVGWWQPEALRIMKVCQEKNFIPIFCGGTGMYLNALLNGIAAIPDPGEKARQEAENRWAEYGGEELLRQLAEKDPRTAQKLKSQDYQRICRAWSVLLGTGKPLSYWLLQPHKTPAECDFKFFHFAPERAFLRSRLERRFDKMLQAGVLDEVEKFLDRDLNPALPLMRAHGVPELKRYREGQLTLADAGNLATSAMRSYAKRQDTWFRHHPLGAEADGLVFKMPVSVEAHADEISPEAAKWIALNFLKERGFFKK